MSKFNNLFMVAIVFFFLLLTGIRVTGRTEPSLHESQVKAIKDGQRERKMNIEVEEVSCEGVDENEDDCLMRRTLAAHTDYIYTQNHKP